jgi:hypothetical protein
LVLAAVYLVGAALTHRWWTIIVVPLFYVTGMALGAVLNRAKT